MLYILDTDHLSLLQRGHTLLQQNLQNIPLEQRAITMITVAEQIQGRLAIVHRNHSEEEVSRGLLRLWEAIRFYGQLYVLPYDEEAVVIYETLRQRKIRVGTQDMRIAAIALRWQATLLTRNYKDFSRIPDLMIADLSEQR